MKESTPRPRLIGLDWGTTGLRAYLMGEGGRVLESRERPWGIRHLPAGGFDAALDGIVADWPDLPVLASGMVGSRGGWREVPYVELPATIDAVVVALGSVDSVSGRRVHLVPGLRNTVVADVMRGEETEIFGALALQPVLAGRSALLLPGTHSKWVNVLHGRVVDFAAPVFAIEVDGEASGTVGVRPGQGERRHGAELGYWLGRRHWNQGRMTRVVGAYAPWVMRALSLHRLQATVLDSNEASARVLLKNGFVEEGVLRRAVFKRGRLHDLRMFALTREGLDDGA